MTGSVRKPTSVKLVTLFVFALMASMVMAAETQPSDYNQWLKASSAKTQANVPDALIASRLVDTSLRGQTTLDKLQLSQAAHFELAQGAHWVTQQGGKGYSIQLMSGRDKNTMLRSLMTVRSKANTVVMVYPYGSGDEQRYALLWGEYDSVSSAKQAASEIPAEFVKGQPWIRGFKALDQAR